MNRESTAGGLFPWRELGVAFGFALVSAAAHLVWNPIVLYWQFIASTALFAAILIVWLVCEWRRLTGFITRAYCVAAIFDLIAEGLLQPFHHCTLDNLFCTGRMFLVFLAFWLVAYPLERLLRSRG